MRSAVIGMLFLGLCSCQHLFNREAYSKCEDVDFATTSETARRIAIGDDAEEAVCKIVAAGGVDVSRYISTFIFFLPAWNHRAVDAEFYYQSPYSSKAFLRGPGWCGEYMRLQRTLFSPGVVFPAPEMSEKFQYLTNPQPIGRISTAWYTLRDQTGLEIHTAKFRRERNDVVVDLQMGEPGIGYADKTQWREKSRQVKSVTLK